MAQTLPKDAFPPSCKFCGHRLRRDNSCPDCGRTQSFSFEPKTKQPARTLNFAFAFGLFFWPQIFHWFTLRKGFSNSLRAISFLWVIVAVFAVMSINNNSDLSLEKIAAPPIAEVLWNNKLTDLKRSAETYVSPGRNLVGFEVKKIGAGNTLTIDFEVVNSNSAPLASFAITCTNLDIRGKKLLTKTKVFDDGVPAQMLKAYTGVNMDLKHDPGSHPVCELMDVTLKN